MPILIVGLSTRAIAESAVRGGYDVVTLDYFGDQDQRALVENRALQRDFGLPFSAEALLEASRTLDFEAVVYVSNLENHPGLVQELAEGRDLLGNPPRTLTQVRDWHTLRAVCGEEEILHPTTFLPGEEAAADPGRPWLRKPRRGGGGHGIRPWRGGPLAEDHILQQHLDGPPASAAFVADGQRAVVIGVTEQLIGREELGAGGFTWCGNILPLDTPFSLGAVVLNEIKAVVSQLTRRFRLRGVNGIDFVLARDREGRRRPFLVEVNPRYTGSMELMGRAYGVNVFSLHVEAVAGRLPDFSLARQLQSQQSTFGKAIVYARSEVTMPCTQDWSRRGRRDIPHPGERIEAGHPICTVLSAADDRAACWSDLLSRSRAVRREIGDKIGGTL